MLRCLHYHWQVGGKDPVPPFIARQSHGIGGVTGHDNLAIGLKPNSRANIRACTKIGRHDSAYTEGLIQSAIRLISDQCEVTSPFAKWGPNVTSYQYLSA